MIIIPTTRKTAVLAKPESASVTVTIPNAAMARTESTVVTETGMQGSV